MIPQIARLGRIPNFYRRGTFLRNVFCHTPFIVTVEEDSPNCKVGEDRLRAVVTNVNKVNFIIGSTSAKANDRIWDWTNSWMRRTCSHRRSLGTFQPYIRSSHLPFLSTWFSNAQWSLSLLGWVLSSISLVVVRPHKVVPQRKVQNPSLGINEPKAPLLQNHTDRIWVVLNVFFDIIFCNSCPIQRLEYEFSDVCGWKYFSPWPFRGFTDGPCDLIWEISQKLGKIIRFCLFTALLSFLSGPLSRLIDKGGDKGLGVFGPVWGGDKGFGGFGPVWISLSRLIDKGGGPVWVNGGFGGANGGGPFWATLAINGVVEGFLVCTFQV
jgi:hypothetical protein